MDAHYVDMCDLLGAKMKASERRQGSDDGSGGERLRRKRAEEQDLKVGVFFCGSPVVGMQLAEACRALTARGREDGTFVEYHFMMEVFG